MSSFKNHDRQYDVVVYGATGYTGKFTAEYVVANFPTNTKWAVAGRSQHKLQTVVDECKKKYPDRAQPELETASLNDEDMSVLAKKTFVLITTVGPYSRFGEPAFKACAEFGTHYIDITGEPVWIKQMISKYEKVANASGALMFPQAGLDSAPSDLSTWALAKAIRTELGVPTKETTISLHSFVSTPSGGSMESFLSLFEVYTPAQVIEAGKPYALSPIPHKEPSRPKDSLLESIFGVRSISHLGLVTSSFMAAADTPIVERTWGLLASTPSRKNEFYGHNFTWSQYFKTRNWFQGVFVHWTLSAFGLLLAFVPPFRTLLRRSIYQPGQGIDADEAAKTNELEFRGVAHPDSEEHKNKIAYSRLWHRGGMYYMTGLFVGEAARTILEDDLGLEGGVWTPALMGQYLIDRLDKAGVHTEVQVVDA